MAPGSSNAATVSRARRAGRRSTPDNFALIETVSDILFLEINTESLALQHARGELERGRALGDLLGTAFVDGFELAVRMPFFEHRNRLEHRGPYTQLVAALGHVATRIQRLCRLEETLHEGNVLVAATLGALK